MHSGLLQVCAVSFGEFCSVVGRQNTEESMVSSTALKCVMLQLHLVQLYCTNDRESRQIGKIMIYLALHWLRVTDVLSGLPAYAQGNT